MRHEHLTVTVEGGTKARIEEELDGGETVEAWIADAIEQKLAASEDGEEDGSSEGDGPDRAPGAAGNSERVARAGRVSDDDRDAEGRPGKHRWDADPVTDDDDRDSARSDDDSDDRDEGYEFVDDCGI